MKMQASLSQRCWSLCAQILLQKKSTCPDWRRSILFYILCIIFLSCPASSVTSRLFLFSPVSPGVSCTSRLLQFFIRSSNVDTCYYEVILQTSFARWEKPFFTCFYVDLFQTSRNVFLPYGVCLKTYQIICCSYQLCDRTPALCRCLIGRRSASEQRGRAREAGIEREREGGTNQMSGWRSPAYGRWTWSLWTTTWILAER